MTELRPRLSRRGLIASGMVATVAALSQPAWRPFRAATGGGGDATLPEPPGRGLVATLDPNLLRRALVALRRHAAAVAHHDRLAIIDFSAPSAQARLHLLHLGDGRTDKFLVAHGSGSDPDHTGFLQSFSNEIDSNASSAGAFITAEYYDGKHGHSQRLLGLDPTNCNAQTRAIVVHAAWYANPEMIKARGKLGRSQGCFAVGQQDLATVFDRLGTGRMIFAAKA